MPDQESGTGACRGRGFLPHLLPRPVQVPFTGLHTQHILAALPRIFKVRRMTAVMRGKCGSSQPPSCISPICADWHCRAAHGGRQHPLPPHFPPGRWARPWGGAGGGTPPCAAWPSRPSRPRGSGVWRLPVCPREWATVQGGTHVTARWHYQARSFRAEQLFLGQQCRPMSPVGSVDVKCL